MKFTSLIFEEPTEYQNVVQPLEETSKDTTKRLK